jgi:hypothetical protein
MWWRIRKHYSWNYTIYNFVLSSSGAPWIFPDRASSFCCHGVGSISQVKTALMVVATFLSSLLVFLLSVLQEKSLSILYSIRLGGGANFNDSKRSCRLLNLLHGWVVLGRPVLMVENGSLTSLWLSWQWVLSSTRHSSHNRFRYSALGVSWSEKEFKGSYPWTK